MQKFLLCLGISLMWLFSFSQNVTFKISPLTGTWVESVHKTDTLVFIAQYEGETPGFELHRQNILLDGHPAPGWNSGYYHYTLSENSININWLLSGDSRYKPVYFSQKPGENKLRIGDFFSIPRLSKDTLTFIRIK